MSAKWMLICVGWMAALAGIAAPAAGQYYPPPPPPQQPGGILGAIITSYLYGR